MTRRTLKKSVAIVLTLLGFVTLFYKDYFVINEIARSELTLLAVGFFMFGFVSYLISTTRDEDDAR